MTRIENVIVEFTDHGTLRLIRPLGDGRYVPVEVDLDNSYGQMLELLIKVWMEPPRDE